MRSSTTKALLLTGALFAAALAFAKIAPGTVLQPNAQRWVSAVAFVAAALIVFRLARLGGRLLPPLFERASVRVWLGAAIGICSIFWILIFPRFFPHPGPVGAELWMLSVLAGMCAGMVLLIGGLISRL
ncbi:MAG TPA: hypothetical protein VHU87_15600 [Rhizomicrobium sp.]|nr:hypothetical protein [Rhizomicrobium sp.]